MDRRASYLYQITCEPSSSIPSDEEYFDEQRVSKKSLIFNFNLKPLKQGKTNLFVLISVITEFDRNGTRLFTLLPVFGVRLFAIVCAKIDKQFHIIIYDS